MNAKALMTLTELADLLGVSRRQMYRQPQQTRMFLAPRAFGRRKYLRSKAEAFLRGQSLARVS